MLSGELARMEGDPTTSRANVADALRAVRNVGLQPMVLTGLRSLGGCWLAMGNPGTGDAIVWRGGDGGAGAAVPSTLCPPLAVRFPIRYAEDVAMARGCLGGERFTAAWAAGEDTPLEVALADALDETPELARRHTPALKEFCGGAEGEGRAIGAAAPALQSPKLNAVIARHTCQRHAVFERGPQDAEALKRLLLLCLTRPRFGVVCQRSLVPDQHADPIEPDRARACIRPSLCGSASPAYWACPTHVN